MVEVLIIAFFGLLSGAIKGLYTLRSYLKLAQPWRKGELVLDIILDLITAYVAAIMAGCIALILSSPFTSILLSLAVGFWGRDVLNVLSKFWTQLLGGVNVDRNGDIYNQVSVDAAEAIHESTKKLSEQEARLIEKKAEIEVLKAEIMRLSEALVERKENDDD